MAEPKSNELMEKLVSLCKRRGFIFQSSEIYGGINGFWDYGPLGAELKRNVKNLWWRSMTQERDDVVGLDATIIMHPTVWKASGHVDTFTDPMVDCKACGKRFRADQVEKVDGTVHHYTGALEATEWKQALAEIHIAKRRTVETLVQQITHETKPAGVDSSQAPSPRAIDELCSLIEAKPGDPRIDALLQTYAAMAPSRLNEEFAALAPSNKGHILPGGAAKQFYLRRGLKTPMPIPGATETVQATAAYCEHCGGQLTAPRPFNLMFSTAVGPVASEDNIAYLRPETAQAIFVQFKNVLDCSRQKVPFGIAQVGKAFRNEVTPRNFTFRSREFEQMELEFFIRPDEVVAQLAGKITGIDPANPHAALSTPPSGWGWEVWHKYWVEERLRWYESIGLPRTSLEEYWQTPEELAHYAKATVDILYKFPFGTQELEGIAARGNFDLTQHQNTSGKSMEYFDEEAKAKYVPHVIEPSAGADRLVLALLCNAYSEDSAPNDKGQMESRIVMKLHPRVAPIKVGIFPLLKNRPELVRKAREVRDLLRPHLTVFYDEAGAIGRRYRRQDEAGTPFGVTIDFDTLGENGDALKNTVTLRDRDTLRQERISIGQLLPLLLDKTR